MIRTLPSIEFTLRMREAVRSEVDDRSIEMLLALLSDSFKNVAIDNYRTIDGTAVSA